MKKIFLARRNALLSGAPGSYGTYALLLVIVVLAIRLFAPSVFWSLFTPVFRVSDSLSGVGHALFSGFGDSIRLTLENEQLKKENEALIRANQELGSASEIVAAISKGGGIVAGVIARPPMSPYDEFIVAAGVEEGVILNMEAFGEGGVPLGIVTSLSEHVSHITLFSSPGISVDGWVGPSNLAITLRGTGAGTMSASVSRSANVEAGNIVSVPGPGLKTLGTVVRVDSDSTSPSVELRIMLAANLFSIGWVELRETGAFATTTKRLK